MHEPHITVVGNVGAEPRTRVVAGGAVVTDFRIASTPRKVDKDGNWNDRETIWFGVSCWRVTAENVAASLSKGDRVIVTGRLTAHSWLTDKGEQRSALEIEAANIGFDLSKGKATLERSAPLTLSTDPGYRSTGEVDTESGRVSITTGEVLGEEDDELDEDDPRDDDETSLGKPEHALV